MSVADVYVAPIIYTTKSPQGQIGWEIIDLTVVLYPFWD